MRSSVQTGIIHCEFLEVKQPETSIRGTRGETLLMLPPLIKDETITHREAGELGDFLNELNHRTLEYISKMPPRDESVGSQIRRALHDMKINFEQKLEDLPKYCVGEIMIAISIGTLPFATMPYAYVPLSAAINYKSNLNFKSTTDELLDFLRNN